MKRQKVNLGFLLLLVLVVLQQASAEVSDEIGSRFEEAMDELKAIGNMIEDPDTPDFVDQILMEVAKAAETTRAVAAESEAKLGPAKAWEAWAVAKEADEKFEKLITKAYYGPEGEVPDVWDFLRAGFA